MNREYHKWFSPCLGRDMELLVFGHAGMPLLVFPTSMGRFYDYEDRGMIRIISSRYEEGIIQAYCVDSVDQESWYNRSIQPRERVLRHLDYESYLLREAIPFIRSRNSSGSPITTGCSFGGYHAVNFSLRHPDQVGGCVSMGGAFDIHQFLNGFYDDNCYFNCPPDFLPGLNDPWFLEKIRAFRKFVLATGERDICLYDNCHLSHLLSQKGIPHDLDVWGDGTGHDWLWWQHMAIKFFP